MQPSFQKVLVIVAAGAAVALMLGSLALLGGAGCAVFPLGVCPLPR